MATDNRPRRSTRVPAKLQEKPAQNAPTPSKKRKAPVEKDNHLDLDYILTNKKSPLVNLELSTLINENTWFALSPDSRALLSTLLPPTVFPFYRPTLDQSHPANKQRRESGSSDMNVDALALGSEPDPSFFTDPFFEAGARTFQDHLYSGWFTPAHEALVNEYTDKVKNGETHAPWKDDVWLREHPVTETRSLDADVPAGEASSITLGDLAKHSILRKGDVLAYRRNFPQFNYTVSKDAIIESLLPSLTILASPSSQTHLPIALLEHPDTAHRAPEPEAMLRVMAIRSPSHLENALLDIDGRIEKAKRPNANAWKSIGVWRFRDGGAPDLSTYPEDSEEAARGGREYRGTLFYLRGCFYDEL